MKNLKLASMDMDQRMVINVFNVEVGQNFVVISGPCSVESEAQTIETAHSVKAAGANMLRVGAFKPRTSPYAFQGLGLSGLKILAKARQETRLPVVSEVIDPRDVSWVAEFADVLQIGTRNMQKFLLLKEVGEVERPVLLKRGMYFTLEEWLNCAESLFLCERGIRTFERTGRLSLIATMSLAAVAAEADGLIIEVHNNPKKALCDADQALTPKMFAGLMD